MQAIIQIFVLISFSVLSTKSQILRRQYIGDGQQLQVPVRRINIPYNLRDGQRSDQRPDLIETPIRKECSKCVDRKYVQHYMARGCTPVIKGGCDCPSRYDCPKSETIVDSKVCSFRGKTYRVGDSIPTENVCNICECRAVGRNAEIDCSVQIECPVETFGQKRREGCYGFYEPNKCCARDECPAKSARFLRDKVCTFKGQLYRLGEKIPADGCVACICTQQWDDNKPLDNSSCKRVGCDLELNSRLKSGCTPIYHEDGCCPVDYKCPKRNTLRIEGLESGSLMCAFEGRKYPIGSHLFHDNKCVNCVCDLPPQFTCIQKSNCY